MTERATDTLKSFCKTGKTKSRPLVHATFFFQAYVEVKKTIHGGLRSVGPMLNMQPFFEI